MTGARWAATETGIRELVRRHIPAGMRCTVSVVMSLEVGWPKARFVLSTEAASIEKTLELDVDDPARMAEDIDACLPHWVHECWTAGLTLAPDGDDIRERSYAIANAVDATPTPPPCDCGAWPPHSGNPSGCGE